MIRTVSAAALLSLALLTSTSAPSAGPLAVVHMHQELFDAIDAGDAEAARAFLHADMHMDDRWRRRPCTLALDGVDGTTGLAVGRTASLGLLDDWVDAAETGASTRITSWVSDCHSGELSYAVLEFERTRVEDGRQMTQRYVSTSLVTYVDGGWRITHMQVARAPEKRPGSIALGSTGIGESESKGDR